MAGNRESAFPSTITKNHQLFLFSDISPAVREKKINYVRLFPMFVLGFLAMALLKTFGLIPDLVFHVTGAL